MKIAILGDSHTAAMKFALDDNPGLVNGHEVTFFASPAAGMNGLGVEEGKLVPANTPLSDHFDRTSGGLKEINPTDYDTFILVSLGLLVPHLDLRLSEAVRRMAIADAVRQCLARRIFNRIRRVSDKPVFALHRPLLAYGGLMDYNNVFSEMDKVARDLGLPLIPQAPEAVVAAIWTRPEFTRSSRRLLSQAEHEETDNMHMNSDFGRIALTHLFNTISSEFPKVDHQS